MKTKELRFASRSQFESIQRLVAMAGLKFSCGYTAGLWHLRYWEVSK